MDYDQPARDAGSLTTWSNQPLVGVLSEQDGREIVRYFAGDEAVRSSSDDTLQAALRVIGAWADLDWDEFSAELDRIRHESSPTPPIEL